MHWASAWPQPKVVAGASAGASTSGCAPTIGRHIGAGLVASLWPIVGCLAGQL